MVALWTGQYISLREDGTLSISDGVGYVGEEGDLRELKEELNKMDLDKIYSKR